MQTGIKGVSKSCHILASKETKTIHVKPLFVTGYINKNYYC